MRVYPLIFKTVFVPLDAELAHKIGFVAIKALRPLRIAVLAKKYLRPSPLLQTEVMGLHFPSTFGLAAGFDKTGSGINALGDLGFGHIEVGTITAHAQPGNPKPRLFRLVDDCAVINRMGFNNDGAAQAGPRIALARAEMERDYADEKMFRPLIGINIGKTKTVALEDAVEDYRYSSRTLAPQADYLAVNVSSPNTPGLRNLQAVETLRPLLQAVREEADAVVGDRHVPLVVKIAPDLNDEDIQEVAELALDMGLDGIIATNTTIERNSLGLKSSRQKVQECGAGGLSGAPLKQRSLAVTRLLKEMK